MTKDEALTIVLEALEADELDMVDDGNGNMVFRKEQAIAALKEALAQPNYRAVKTYHEGEPVYVAQPEQNLNCKSTQARLATAWGYVKAQPEQEPVAWMYPEGLDALRSGKPWTAYGTRQEPNNTALYLSPQPDIPPYAWVTFTPYGDEDDVWYENPEGQLIEGWTYKPLYDTTPPPQRTWVGLTDEEIKVMDAGFISNASFYAGAFWAEAKLKEKNT